MIGQLAGQTWLRHVRKPRWKWLLVFAGACGCTPAAALAASLPPVSPPLLYADLVDLADSAPLVLVAEIRGFANLEPTQARGVRDGWARVYVEARPLGVLRGDITGVAGFRYLADVKLDARGKLPTLKKQQVLLFARAALGGTAKKMPGESVPPVDDIQLVAPDAQMFRNAELEARIIGVLAELSAPDAPGQVTAVNEALFEPGTLAGAGETQIFLATVKGAPASISVVHLAGQMARWSVSFSEVVDASGKPPARDTLAWYRLACFLPADLPPATNVSDSDEGRRQAVADYRLVREDLGQCSRNRP